MIRAFQDNDLKLLRVFRAIVESGGFSAAQVSLNTSASRISSQMTELETRLGVRLCDRGRGGFSLTEEGLAVYEESRKLFLAIEEFRLNVSDKQRRLAGEIRLGLIDNLISNAGARVAQTIARFKQRDNDVTFDLRIEQSLELEAGVVDGRLHMAIGYFHHRVSPLDYRRLFGEIHHLYCGRRHPLFGRDDSLLRPEELHRYDYANRRYFESQGELASDFGTRGTAATDNMEALAVLILSGAYLAYLPSDYARHWVDGGEMRAILPGRLAQTATLHLITRKGVRQSRVVETFLEDLIAEHAERPRRRASSKC